MEFKKEEEKVLLQKTVRSLLNDSRLNEWEKDFLASISSQLRARDMSDKQLNVLNRIKQKYAKAMQ